MNLNDVDLFIPRGERLSGAFTFDYYVQGLRRLTKWIAYSESENIGKIIWIDLDINQMSTNIFTLINGHSSRSYFRYRYISDLIDTINFENEAPLDKSLVKTKYFIYLYERYRDQGLWARFRGRSNCLIKVKRTLSLSSFYVENNHSFRGFSSGVKSIKDYPLCLSFEGLTDGIVELDGSHRRCVAYYHGSRKIESNVIDIGEIEKWMNQNLENNSYFLKHWDTYKNILKSIEIKKV